MLTNLSIRDVVLIDRLALTFDGPITGPDRLLSDAGLGVLTGETGAGKSILLDALGLAIGARADAGLVRKSCEAASVTATFEIPTDHPALITLRDHDLEDIADRATEEGLVLRRRVAANGRSRAHINDEPVSVGLLKEVGERLIEIHGQFETQGLLNAQSHLALLDTFTGLTDNRAACSTAWNTWRDLTVQRRRMLADAAQSKAEEEFLRSALEELQTLDPKAGEEKSLSDRRAFLMSREKLTDSLNIAADGISGDSGAQARIGQVLKALDRVEETGGALFKPLIEALDRASAEIDEAAAQINHLAGEIEGGADDLATLEDRLFALRDLARKHRVEPDALPDLQADFERRLGLIADSSSARAKLDQEIEAARTIYAKAAEALSNKRHAGATRFDTAINSELPPLKLENARFETSLETLGEQDWGPNGQDRATFCVATNPGAPAEPLARIASGGELARLMLAIKVTLSRSAGGTSSTGPTLIFDEVDSGISGSVADAVGKRLAEIGRQGQVLAVTHSPQVAARAHRHWRVAKTIEGAQAQTSISELQSADRREEIARMLSGASITDQARAAADTLLSKRAS